MRLGRVQAPDLGAPVGIWGWARWPLMGEARREWSAFWPGMVGGPTGAGGEGCQQCALCETIRCDIFRQPINSESMGTPTLIAVVFLLAAALAAASCDKPKTEATEPVMKKVEAAGPGLPVAQGPGAPVREAPSTAPTAGVPPNDEVHRRAMSARASEIPEGHGAPVGPDDLDGNPLPLKKKGLGSAAELAAALARVQGDEARRRFEEGFRLTFCVDRARRDLARARAAFEEVLKAQPTLAEAYRGLAYVTLSDQFDVAQAEAHYRKALELRPDYGEVHYALAFLYSMSDRAKGAEHFRKAMAAGVSDEQGLVRLYGQ